MILGFDEVGRGAWAGPLVVGACILPDNCQIEGLTDSKKLTAKKREVLNKVIRDQAVGFSLGWVSAAELDRIGITAALKLAAQRALAGIDAAALARVEQIVVDGTIDFVGDARAVIMKQADLLIPSVSAAAILAKVARDQAMMELGSDERYAGYGFAKHVGYGTRAHHQAVIELGISDQHRKSFRPMSEMLGFVSQNSAPKLKSDLKIAKNIGDWGEKEVVKWLEARDFEILSQNWRTKLFEIDIVAKKDAEIYLIEVKTRKNADFGGGEAAINHQKKRKLQLAAETVLTKYPEVAVKISAIFVTGRPEDFTISELIELQ